MNEAQAGLLGVVRTEDAIEVLTRLVERLGGEVVPAHLPGADAIPVDLTLGWRDARVATAPRGTPAYERLARVLPTLVEQARRVVDLVELAGRRGHLDGVDLLTGLATRAELARTAELAVAGADRYLGFAVADPGLVVEAYGRAHLDALVRTLADVVTVHTHPFDHLGRLNGPGVGALVVRADPTRLAYVTGAVRASWSERRSADVELTSAEVVATDDAEDSLHRLETQLQLAPTPHVDVSGKVDR